MIRNRIHHPPYLHHLYKEARLTRLSGVQRRRMIVTPTPNQEEGRSECNYRPSEVSASHLQTLNILGDVRKLQKARPALPAGHRYKAAALQLNLSLYQARKTLGHSHTVLAPRHSLRHQRTQTQSSGITHCCTIQRTQTEVNLLARRRL